MNRKKISAFLVLFVVLSSTILSSCQSESREVHAILRQGKAEVLKKGESEWQPLIDEMIITPGDSIRTAVDSWVNLNINDGSSVGITPETETSLITFSKKMENPETIFSLSDGMVYVNVTKELGKGSFKVRTPILTGSVVGSQMSVQYIPELNTSNVTCFEGNVNAEFTSDANSNPTSCHLISGVKLSANSQDEVTVKKCQYPVKVSREEVKAYSDWERMGLSVQWLIQTEQMEGQTQTREARFTKTPTATEVIYPTDTLLPTVTPTLTITPIPFLLPTITVDPSMPPSEEEQINSGIHDYTFTASYSGNCSGDTSGQVNQMQIKFEGNQAILSTNGNQSSFSKVGENMYQGYDGDQVTTVTFSQSGFTGQVHCAEWVYTLVK